MIFEYNNDNVNIYNFDKRNNVKSSGCYKNNMQTLSVLLETV